MEIESRPEDFTSGRKEKQAFFLSHGSPNRLTGRRRAAGGPQLHSHCGRPSPGAGVTRNGVSSPERQTMPAPCSGASTPWGPAVFMKPPGVQDQRHTGPAGQKHAPCPEKWPCGGQQGRGWRGRDPPSGGSPGRGGSAELSARNKSPVILSILSRELRPVPG